MATALSNIISILNPDSPLVSGLLRGNPVKNVGELMGDPMVMRKNIFILAILSHLISDFIVDMCL